MATYMNLATASYKTETTRERAYTARCALEAGIVAMTDDYSSGKVTVNSVPIYSTPAGTVSLSLVDNTSTITRSIVANASIAYRSKTYKLTRVVGKRYANPVPNTYALFVNGNVTLTSNTPITTVSSTVDGATYIKGNLNGASNLTVAGDLETNNDISGSPTVSGYKNSSESSLNFPSVSSGNYVSIGTLLNVLLLLSVLNLGSNYPVYYVSSPTTFTYNGSISGAGCLEAKSMDVTGDLTYADSSSVAAFVMTNEITVESAASTISGYYYCNGTFTTNGPLTINGSLVCNSMSLGGPLTINYDSRIWTNESLAASLHLPGAFP